MYDLNLSVPNITSVKYSNDNRFLLLKNYLYELNEALSHALDVKSQGELMALEEKIETTRKSQQEHVTILNGASRERFNELKEKILSTAQDIEKDYNSKIEQSKTAILQSVTGDFVGKSEFGEYSAQTETQIQQNSSDIKLVSENTEAVSQDLEGYKKSAKAELTLQAEAISTHIENLYVTKEDSQSLENRVNAQIVASADNITEQFSESVTKVSGDLSSLGGEVSELVSSLDVYIRRGELEEGVYGIEIGRSDSNVKARFTNDKLSFYQGVAEVAYISGSALYITNAEIIDYLKIGNSNDGYFLFDTTRNGLEVRWIDGD